MLEKTLHKYDLLNQLAEQEGIVLFGGTDDLNIPVCELKQAFSIEKNIYNRSFENLSLDIAVMVYDKVIQPLLPDTLLIHLGSADLQLFNETPAQFDQNYRKLVSHIRTSNPSCRIAVVSLKNLNQNSQVDELNKHLKYLAEAEHCEFFDISGKKIWNPKNLKDSISFVHSIGFVRPLKMKQPLYDLIRIFFCYLD